MTGERPRPPHHLAVREAGEAAFAFRVPLPLHRAIYVSDAVGGAATSLLILAEILGESERNNRREGLTSALMRHGGQFLQIIEGRRADVDRLMAQLHRLVDAGNTVVVIEHEMRVVAQADWVIDMGPGAGERGGKVVAEGRPAQVAKVKESRTAEYLAAAFEN